MAIEAAPERVRMTMLHRLETTFKLLIDQGRWSTLEPPPPDPSAAAPAWRVPCRSGARFQARAENRNARFGARVRVEAHDFCRR
jgi:hypothetical protein